MNEEIDVKIGTKKERAWRDIKDEAMKEIERSKRIILMDKAIIKLAERMIKKEKTLNSS